MKEEIGLNAKKECFSPGTYNGCIFSSRILLLAPIDHFTVACSVTWPLNGREAGGDLALIQTSVHFSCKCT